jgi:alanine racemase
MPAAPHIDVVVDTQRFAANVGKIRKHVAPAALCTVLKSNAYGHGLKQLAPVAVEAGSDWIGICTNPEAQSIRDLGLDVKLLRLRMALPEEYEAALDLDVDEQVGTLQAAEFLADLGQRRGEPVRVHINVDTGIGRSGFFPSDAAGLRQVCQASSLRVVGVMTHFASADGTDLEQTQQQLAAFETALEALQDVLPNDVLIHSHNSAAAMRMPDAHNHLARVGAACYGVRTSQEFDNIPGLQPVMSVKTKVAAVRDVPAGRTIGYGSRFVTERDSRIASLPVGFGEGYPRSLFNEGIVLIHGRRCPVIGRVSLNIVTVDVTDLPSLVDWGDEAVLVGCQGDEEVTFEELADRFDSVHTEINLMAGFMNDVRYV